MWDTLARVFSTSGFPARWSCGRWSEALGWLHIVSDVATWAAYTTIPLLLLYVVGRRRDLPFPRVFWLFGVFIFACGSVHLMEAIIFWWPAYRLAGGLKLLTAVVSWATVFSLVRVLPAATSLPGLKQVNEQLAREVAAGERARRQLRLATRDLQRSNDELQQFAWAASHELQEPLRIVNSYCQLVKERHGQRLDGEARHFIQQAVEGSERMSRLIRDLLEFSRVGTAGVEPERVDGDELMQQAVSNLEATIAESGATIDYDPLPELVVQPTQFVRVLQNLMSNAIKYRSPDRPPRIRLDVRRADGEWIFSLSDNGIGIDLRHRERIFHVFKRLHSRDEYPGTGIGLAMCKKVVERWDGRIWVDSEPGRGSTFHFTLPLEPAAGRDGNLDDAAIA